MTRIEEIPGQFKLTQDFSNIKLVIKKEEVDIAICNHRREMSHRRCRKKYKYRLQYSHTYGHCQQKKVTCISMRQYSPYKVLLHSHHNIAGYYKKTAMYIYFPRMGLNRHYPIEVIYSPGSGVWLKDF